jgi:hypothetical protein
MNEITHQIQQKTRQSEKQTKHWLKDNGLSSDYFADAQLHLIQAQKIASNILKYHAGLLGQNEAHTLDNFLTAVAHKKTRLKLTAASAYKVMNIGKAVNRKLFKAHKKVK